LLNYYVKYTKSTVPDRLRQTVSTDGDPLNIATALQSIATGC
jgi:hypothetical protein